MVDVIVTVRYMHGLVKKLYQTIHRSKFLICHTDPDRTSAHSQIQNICTQTQNKISRQSTETNANKKTPEGVYAGCVGVRKNYRYVEWQWKIE